MKDLNNLLIFLFVNFTDWKADQPYNVQWAVNCAFLGIFVLVVELVMVITGIWNWPILLITILFFSIGTNTLYCDEYWNGPGGD
jgi:hypothetical protein